MSHNYINLVHKTQTQIEILTKGMMHIGNCCKELNQRVRILEKQALENKHLLQVVLDLTTDEILEMDDLDNLMSKFMDNI